MSKIDSNSFLCLGESESRRLSSSVSSILLPKSPIRSPTVSPRALASGSRFFTFGESSPFNHLEMMFYYVVFAKAKFDPVWIAILTFSLDFSTYVGEMLRTSIESIPKGQKEAALSLGLTNAEAFIKIIFPQVIRQILPVYRGTLVNMLKSTAIVGYIAILDLTKMSDIVRSRTYEAFFPLIVTALIYFAIAGLFVKVISIYEFKLKKH